MWSHMLYTVMKGDESAIQWCSFLFIAQWKCIDYLYLRKVSPFYSLNYTAYLL